MFSFASCLTLLASILVLPAIALPSPPVPYSTEPSIDKSITVPSPGGAPVPLTQSQIDSFTPAIRYTSAAYCSLPQLASWNCGASCNANPGFKTAAVGGDGLQTPRCKFYLPFLGVPFTQLPSSHQGTLGLIPLHRPASRGIKDQIQTASSLS